MTSWNLASSEDLRGRFGPCVDTVASDNLTGRPRPL